MGVCSSLICHNTNRKLTRKRTVNRDTQCLRDTPHRDYIDCCPGKNKYSISGFPCDNKFLVRGNFNGKSHPLTSSRDIA